MATNTYMTFLMHKASSSGSYAKIADIKDFPDLGSAPELLPTTTLSDKRETNILGIQSATTLSFTLNYDGDVYDTIDALEGVHYWALYLGGTESGSTVTPTGDLGKFEWQGEASIYFSGKGVNEVREMIVTISTATPVEKTA